MNTKEKGNIAELKIAARLTELGHQVFFPFGENCSYDLVIDEAGELKRIQCKYVTLKNGCLDIPLYSVYLVEGEYKKHRYTDLDYVAVYCPDLGSMYLIPHEDVKQTKTSVSMRIDAAKGIGPNPTRWAKDYEI